MTAMTADDLDFDEPVPTDRPVTVVAPYPAVDGTQACADGALSMFFPEDSTHWLHTPHAIARCRRCPFLEDCLAYALTHDVSGIWGGTTHAQRQRLRRDYGIDAMPVHNLEASRMNNWQIA